MRSRNLRLMLICAASVAVSSCGSKVAIPPSFPPVADLQVDAEPAYPEAALEPTDAGREAEAKWWNDTLIWGRTHHDRVARICTWARDLKLKLPSASYCGK